MDWASPGRVAASCIATAAAVAIGAGATAAPAPRSSGVALLTYVDVNGGLCAMRADGSHRVRLLGSRPAVHAPAWSADGRYVAFVGAVSAQIKIVVADSRGRVRWHIDAAHYAQSALWSPDGRHIAYIFSSPYGDGLAVVRPDGSDDQVVALSPPPAPDAPNAPAWAPDGRRLGFDYGGSNQVPQGIYSDSVDGGDRRLLVANAIEPAFSPDGSKLAYVALGGASSRGVYIADADGSNPRSLALSTNATAPTWSPNGKRVAFLRGDAIVVANPDGSNERVIASAATSAPDWSPDSKLIAFRRGPTSIVGNRPFTSLLVVARADGGGERVVLRRRSTIYVQDPAWRPATALPRANRLPCPAPS